MNTSEAEELAIMWFGTPLLADLFEPVDCAVLTFTVSAFSDETIPIAAFTATDDSVAFLTTESSTPPLSSDPGWVATAPAEHITANAGTVTVYAWVKDSNGRVGAGKSATAFVVPSLVSWWEPGAGMTTTEGWLERTTAGTRNWRGCGSDSTGDKLVAAVEGGSIWTSDDRGASWTERTVAGATNNWRGVASDATGNRLLACDYGTSLRLSEDRGASWTACAAAGTRPWYGCGSDSTGDKLVAAAYSGSIWTSDDRGASWTERTAAGTRNWLGCGSNATGNRLIAAVNAGSLWLSDDRGVSWTECVAAGTKNWFGCDRDATGDRLIACVTGGSIWTSENGGTSWTEHTAAGTASWRSCDSDSTGARRIAAVYAGSIFSEGLRCSLLTDQSGHAYDFAQSTPASQPHAQLPAWTLNAFPGRAAIWWPYDTSRTLTCTTAGLLTAMAAANTLIVRGKLVSESATAVPLFATAGGEPLKYYIDTNNAIYTTCGTSMTSAALDTGVHTYAGSFDPIAKTATLWVDGVLAGGPTVLTGAAIVPTSVTLSLRRIALVAFGSAGTVMTTAQVMAVHQSLIARGM